MYRRPTVAKCDIKQSEQHNVDFGENPALRALNGKFERFRLAALVGSSPADRAASQMLGSKFGAAKAAAPGRFDS